MDVHTVLESRPRPGVLLLTLNRPRALNPISSREYTLLRDALLAAAADEDTHIVIITGSGSYFTSGADIHNPGDPAVDFARFGDVVLSFPKLLLAAVNGPAVGLGTTLLLHCDAVFAVPSATFTMPFMRIAIVPEFAASVMLPRVVGHQLAHDMLYTGRVITAQEAERAGLVLRLVPDALSAALAHADTVLSFPLAGASIPAFKSLMKRHTLPELQAAHRREVDAMCARIAAGDTAAAMMELMQRRAAAATAGDARTLSTGAAGDGVTLQRPRL